MTLPTRLATALLGCAAVAGAAAAAPICDAHSSATAPLVVELYTSEGCSSCPPADRWLSTLKGRSDVIALAFHVDYWDRLGWTDRYATPAGTARQRELARRAGGDGVYTPQVIVDGVDRRDWRLSRAAGAVGPRIELTRDGDFVGVDVGPLPGAVRELAGYWAVVEDGYASSVRAGENAGATLHHDAVVRLYRPLPPWSAASSLQARLEVTRGNAEHPRRVVFVVTDARSGRPLQALALGC
ncbi:MAG: DUF1223 domain-containing protein [Burkholderiales bacterium]|nr:DUF1223 domain-containing protein [Burkholderiales bacterium]